MEVEQEVVDKVREALKEIKRFRDEYSLLPEVQLVEHIKNELGVEEESYDGFILLKLGDTNVEYGWGFEEIFDSCNFYKTPVLDFEHLLSECENGFFFDKKLIDKNYLEDSAKIVYCVDMLRKLDKDKWEYEECIMKEIGFETRYGDCCEDSISYNHKELGLRVDVSHSEIEDFCFYKDYEDGTIESSGDYKL